MEILVAIEPVDNIGFRARSGEPLPLSADGPTREEALHNLRQLLTAKLKNGTQVIAISFPASNFQQMAGIYEEDDPVIQEWLKIMRENRQKAEDDPSYL